MPRKPRDPWRTLLRRVHSSAARQENNGSGTQQKRKGHVVILTEEDLKAQFKSRTANASARIQLIPNDVFKTWAPLAPGVDRLDNAHGYYPSNIVITSRFANLGRQDTKVADFIPHMRRLQRMMAGKLPTDFLFDDPSLLPVEVVVRRSPPQTNSI
jgi:hypothetical protein